MTAVASPISGITIRKRKTIKYDDKDKGIFEVDKQILLLQIEKKERQKKLLYMIIKIYVLLLLLVISKIG